MKAILTIIACLVTLFSYTQNRADGRYSIKSVRFDVYNYNTKEEVLTRTFTDKASLENINDIPFSIQPIFLSVTMHDGILKECTLWNTKLDYEVSEDGTLMEVIKEDVNSTENLSEKKAFFNSYSLSPLHIFSANGADLVFTTTDLFGNSMYNFPLEGKLTITLTKD